MVHWSGKGAFHELHSPFWVNVGAFWNPGLTRSFQRMVALTQGVIFEYPAQWEMDPDNIDDPSFGALFNRMV